MDLIQDPGFSGRELAFQDSRSMVDNVPIIQVSKTLTGILDRG